MDSVWFLREDSRIMRFRKDSLEHLIRLLNGKNRVDDVFAFFRYSPFGQGVPAHFTTEFVERIGLCVLHSLPFVFHFCQGTAMLFQGNAAKRYFV